MDKMPDSGITALKSQASIAWGLRKNKSAKNVGHVATDRELHDVNSLSAVSPR
jgi:hypothetical protein